MLIYMQYLHKKFSIDNDFREFNIAFTLFSIDVTPPQMGGFKEWEN